MPFITGADYHTLARRLDDICFKSTPQGGQPQLLPLPPTAGNTSFQYYLSSREQCLKFVDLYTQSSLMEVLQVDEEKVRKEMTSILEGKTDLIPNKYEGGFKVWEGLFDLIEYIEKNQIIDKLVASLEGSSHTGVNILDLGCGSGLLSIYIAAQFRLKHPDHAFKIYLQDYNSDVIKYYTIPNVLLNEVLYKLKSEHQSVSEEQPERKVLLNRLVASVQSHFEFLHGDWVHITDEIAARGVKFDLIVSAETLYAPSNYIRLYRTLVTLLRKPRGSTLIATKSHYFGVGGGTLSFLDFVREEKDKPLGALERTLPLTHAAASAIAAAAADRDTPLTKKQKVALSNPLKLDVQVVHDIEAPLLRNILELKWQ